MHAQDWAAGAGLGGLALFLVLIIFRKIIAARLLVQLGKAHSYKILRLLILVTAVVALAGLGAYTYLASQASLASQPKVSAKQTDPLERIAFGMPSASADKVFEHQTRQETISLRSRGDFQAVLQRALAQHFEDKRTRQFDLRLNSKLLQRVLNDATPPKQR